MSEPAFGYSWGRHAAIQPQAPALETHQLSVRYPGTDRWALCELSMSLPGKMRIALVGPNGAGKSTLLKATAGLLPVAAGRLRIHGNPVGACHHRVAYLPQRGDIDWNFPTTVEQLVLAGRYVHLGWFRRPRAADRAIAREMLARMHLSDLAGCPIGRLSGGQQQRALLARALAQQPDLFLLDEPFNAIDAETRTALYRVLRSLREEGKTLVVATHDIGCLQEQFDQVIYLRAGRQVATLADSMPASQGASEAAWTA